MSKQYDDSIKHIAKTPNSASIDEMLKSVLVDMTRYRQSLLLSDQPKTTIDDVGRHRVFVRKFKNRAGECFRICGTGFDETNNLESFEFGDIDTAEEAVERCRSVLKGNIASASMGQRYTFL